MSVLTRLARPVEIPLLERMGYRAVRQRGGLVEMAPPEMIDIGPFEGEPDETLSFDDPPSDARPDVLCTKRKEPADWMIKSSDGGVESRHAGAWTTPSTSPVAAVARGPSDAKPADRDAERLAFDVMANFMGSNV